MSGGYFFIFYIWLYFTIASDVTTGDTLELVDCCTLACILFYLLF